MKIELNLSELFRYAFAGGVAVLVYQLLCLPTDVLLKSNPTTGQLSLGAGLILLLGSAIYTLHRSLLYPPVLRLIHCRVGRSVCLGCYPKKSRNPWAATSLELDFDLARLQRKQKAPQVQDSLDGWGAQAHFFYAVALAMFLAILTNLIFCQSRGGLSIWWFIALTLLVGFAAFVHDSRLVRVEAELFLRERSSTISYGESKPLTTSS